MCVCVCFVLFCFVFFFQFLEGLLFKETYFVSLLASARAFVTFVA